MDIDELLRVACEEGSSDLHLTVGLPPVLRTNGELLPMANYPVLTGDMIIALMIPIMPEVMRQRLEQRGEVDFSHSVKGLARFRVNVFRQRGTLASVMRLIPTDIKGLDSLGLPPVLRTFTEKTRGLVLVTGPTGSGKSTTLAALIDIINNERRAHIITLEDPIEFLHRHKRSVVNQREIGLDSRSFADALRAALREDPDVILVGEMRDLETVSIAVSAAETGHLVFATLHTNDTVQTVDRVIDMFPPHQQQQIRVQFAATMIGIMAQQLIPRIDQPGRAVACEILVATPAIRNLIREGKTHQIYSSLQTGGRLGMQALDASLRDLYNKRQISLQEALMRASDPEEFKRLANL